MKDYKQLALKYLAFNKRRTILTILGVALSAMILFIFVNMGLSFYITQRNETREEVKYEAVFLCASEKVAEQLAGEECIAYTEKRVLPPLEEGEEGKVVVYVNFKHPYLMKGYVEELSEKYSAEYQSTSLSSYYFGDGNVSSLLMQVVVLAVLLVAYIFSIFGVAVVRNSIQLMTLEQIRDYGMLRCMGSTKKQLKEMVFGMGFLMEMSGIAVGVVLGFLVYLLIAWKAELEIGFHVVGIVLILVVFLFDLYFVMQENCKFVNKLTPVAAVRGEFKIKTDKVRVRRKSLAGILFGIEGDYASKNLKRNPSRMWKSVGIMSMGIAMVIVATSLCSMIYSYATKDSGQYGKYQLVDAAVWEPGSGQMMGEGSLMPVKYADMLRSSEMVTVCKDTYEACLYTMNTMELLDHFTEEFANESDYGRYMRDCVSRYEAGKEQNELTKNLFEMLLAENSLVGYDEEDYENLKSVLKEGTLELSERGILLVNGACAMSDSTKDLNGGIWNEYTMTDYQVGDTIEFVDYKKLDALIKERMDKAGVIKEDGTYDYGISRNLLHECHEELVKQGGTKTYIIEGIVSKDTNRAILNGGPRFVLPLDRFEEETGLTSSMSAGKMYHVEGHRLDETLTNLMNERYEWGAVYDQYLYLDILQMMGSIWNVVIGAGLFVLFVVVVNMLNIINTTASDLYLRRKEFAQLRVLGMSKKKLIFTVLMEGTISSVLSGVIGVGMGYVIVSVAMEAISYAFYIDFTFSWGMCAVLVLVSTLILCMTVYLPIRGMKINMAEELLASGE